MNKVILMGRLTRDPDIRYSQAAEPLAIARYTLAVDRRFQRRDNSGNEQTADFISCVAFGKNGEFAESKKSQGYPEPGNASADGFTDIPTGLTGNDLPFK